jgi:hypothetical protein
VKLFGVVKAGALTGIAVGLASHLALADPLRLAQAMPGRAMPPGEIVLIMRSAGFLPTTQPALTGATYVVRAVDPYGTPIRVIVDARYGYILSVHRIAGMEPMRRPPDPYRAWGMRARPDGTDDAIGGADRLAPPRAIPTEPDRSLSAAPAHPPLPKPRASTPAPPNETDSPAAAAAPSPPGDKQAAKQDGFPPVTPLQ